MKLDFIKKVVKYTSTLVLLVGLIVVQNSCHQADHEDGDQTSGLQLSSDDSIILDKTFNILSVLEKNPSIRKIVQEDPALQELATSHLQQINRSLSECGEVPCFVSALKWTEIEEGQIRKALTRLSMTTPFREILSSLKREDRYINYEGLSDSVLIANAWLDAANGINRILDVYLSGTAPHYAIIDSISFQVDDKSFIQTVHDSLIAITNGHNQENPVFYRAPLDAALMALAINDRNEAARYEPLNQGLNAAAYKRIKDISWDKYTYGVILVPGFGPKTPGVPVSDRGALRAQKGALRYHEGLAPFIVVSGGHVYPIKTPFSEAVETRKYMINELNIPEDAIFIDPHARHTTTNIRNTNRIIYRFGIPSDKPVLIVTDPGQTTLIANMAARCERELGYIPYKDLKTLNPEETTYFPTRSSLQANPYDPLDP